MPPPGRVAAALFALLAITLVALLAARRRPWLAVGWLWYAGTLVPVIGFVQVGVQAMADRYTYLPLTGVFVALAWGAAAASRRRVPAAAVAALACASLLALAAATRGEVAVWHSGETLFRRAVAVSPGSWMAWTNLGLAQAEAGKTADAIASYRRSLELAPRQAYTRNDLGRALEQGGDLEGARAQYRQALAFAPGYAMVHNNLGTTYASSGRVDLALPRFEEAVRLDPGYADARYNLARALAILGRREEAGRHAREALRLSPLDEGTRRLLREIERAGPGAGAGAAPGR
jgi:Flp pilus assembly protein TadD